MCVFFCTFEGTCRVKWQGCTFEGTDLAMLAHLESTATLRSPYSRSLTIYVKKGYTQSSTINTSLSIELERVLNSE